MCVDRTLETLWDQVLKGDEKSFAKIHRLMYPDLLRYATSFTNDSDLADDLLQDLFVKFWERKSRIGTLLKVRPYFYRSTRSICLNSLRASKVKASKLMNIRNDDSEFEVEHMMIQDERRQVLEAWALKSINKLPKTQRQVIYLRFYENMEYDQITALTGHQYQSVVNNIYRAMQTLRRNCSINMMHF